ncbi:MAG: hypothetical protein E7477_07690 [Ruminococcaceae bacterium]|nr:hypothetical protein [Oscillospiraceae bacterium]
MAKIITQKAQECGVILGGIGTGSVELFPDGEFHQWQIANVDKWAYALNETNASEGEEHTGALSFWVRTESENETPIVRKLGMKTDQKDFRYSMFAWNKPIETIEFDGKFPVGELKYKDSKLPVDVKMKAIAPFVPHNVKDSSTPGFYIDFTLTNPTDKPIKVSLMSLLRPTFCNDGGCINELYTDGEVTGVFLNSPKYPAWQNRDNEPNRGSLCYSAEGGEISYITAEHTLFSQNFVSYSKLGISEESFLFKFRKTGELPNTTIGKLPTQLSSQISDMTDEAIDKYVAEMMQYPFALSLCDRVRHLNPEFPSTREEKEDFLFACKGSIDRMGTDFGVCALCNKAELKANETKKVRFILSWFFPNHFSKFHNRLGHMYENHFENALEVNKYLSKNSKAIADKAEAFADVLYNTTLPDFYPDSWSAQLSTIIKDSWYIKNGKFGLWEGFSSCGFHTTDITYQASFGLLALFPELQLGQMEMGAAFQREDGRVHHFFTPDLDHVDNGFERIDMNNQFVLMVCRDYLYTGNKDYLERLWIPVQKAMDSIGQLDTDGDGLPDYDTTRNTYDAWNFSGTPTYISVLWLSALKAAVKIATVLGDNERKKQWQDLLKKGLKSLETRLWNGKYYDLWRRDDENGTFVDGSLMTDQISGEWFLRMAGIGGNLSDERIRHLMQTIFDGNYDPNYGLVNATCPDGSSVSLDTYENCQAATIWTGIGYTIAALALSVGMEDICDTIVESTHINQLRCGRLWNHEECGPRYTRPLSSWTTMVAASGLKIDASKKIISLNPYKTDITVPFFTGEHIGTAVFSGDSCEITLKEGSLDGWMIAVGDKIQSVKIKE